MPGRGETRRADSMVSVRRGGPPGGASGVAAGKAPRVELGFGLDLIGGMNPWRQRRERGPGYCVPRTQRSDWTMIQIFA